MKIDTLSFENNNWLLHKSSIENPEDASIVFLFGDSEILKSEQRYNEIKQRYPKAHIVGASSSGNILGVEISKSPIVATAVQFEKGSIEINMKDIEPGASVDKITEALIKELPQEGLKHVFVLSDGLNINGSELVHGINSVSKGFAASGGMAGDGDRFLETWIVCDEPAKQNRILAVGFYGEALTISTGCHGGWNSFGANRLVTRSEGNILYELDNKPALDLYKEYLGEYADDLPYSGMRFPLGIRKDQSSDEIIRTLLAIDETEKSITFAGDIPKGYIVRLMKPDIDALIDGASSAANSINISNSDSALGLVVSCVGRRIVMKQLVEEELEAIEDVLGDNISLTGFYSYGEIAPSDNQVSLCQLHNQTMTLTAIYENLS